MTQQRGLADDLDAMLGTILWAEAVDLCMRRGVDRTLGLEYDEGIREEALLLADAWSATSAAHPRLTDALVAMRAGGWVERAAALNSQLHEGK